MLFDSNADMLNKSCDIFQCNQLKLRLRNTFNLKLHDKVNLRQESPSVRSVHKSVTCKSVTSKDLIDFV